MTYSKIIFSILWPNLSKGPDPAAWLSFISAEMLHRLLLHCVCHEGGFCFCLIVQRGWCWSWTSWIILFSSCWWNSCDGSSQPADSKLVYCVNSWDGYSWARSAHTELHQASVSGLWKYSRLNFGLGLRKLLFSMWDQDRMCLEFSLH